jgi:hypothetical protein
LNGQGLKGALPGAVLGGVTSGVQSLANSASSGLQQVGLSPTVANTATNVVAGGLAPFIASGGNVDAALNGLTNAGIGAAGNLAGQAVGSVLPPGVINNVASGLTNGLVTAGANQIINPMPAPPPNLLSQHIASIDPRLYQRGIAQNNNVAMPSTATTGGLPQPAPATGPVEYIPTGYTPPVKLLPTTGLTAVTDPEMLKKLGIG